jgi:hypothetical protein
MSKKIHAGWVGAMALIPAVIFAFSGGNPGTDNPLPLVRRDLIRTKAPEFPAMIRDLFSTVAFIESAPAPGSTESLMNDKAMADEPVPLPPAAVRYVGYIQFANKGADNGSLVAIVTINGRAWAVSEGELFGEGWSALKVTVKEIELQNPEGKKLVFMYEGERP